MPENVRMAIYKQLSELANIGSPEEFSTAMDDQERRFVFYREASKYSDLGPYEKFNTAMETSRFVSKMDKAHEDLLTRQPEFAAAPAVSTAVQPMPEAEVTNEIGDKVKEAFKAAGKFQPFEYLADVLEAISTGNPVYSPAREEMTRTLEPSGEPGELGVNATKNLLSYMNMPADLLSLLAKTEGDEKDWGRSTLGNVTNAAVGFLNMPLAETEKLLRASGMLLPAYIAVYGYKEAVKLRDEAQMELYKRPLDTVAAAMVTKGVINGVQKAGAYITKGSTRRLPMTVEDIAKGKAFFEHNIGPELAEQVFGMEDAKYIGEQQTPSGGSISLYNITKKGHPLEGSTVTARTLEKHGLEVPKVSPTPITPESITGQPSQFSSPKPIPGISTKETKLPWDMSKVEFENEIALRGTSPMGRSIPQLPGSGRVVVGKYVEEKFASSYARQYSNGPGGKLHVFSRNDLEEVRPGDFYVKKGAQPVMTLKGHDVGLSPREAIIRQAYKEGKTLRPEILEEFPDLVGATKPKSSMKSAPPTSAGGGGKPPVPPIESLTGSKPKFDATPPARDIKKLSPWSVEKPFKDSGAPKTGLAAKNAPSVAASWETRGVKATLDLMRPKKKLLRESFNRDLVNLTKAERKNYFHQIVLEAEKANPDPRYINGWKMYRKYSDNLQKEYVKRGAHIGFKENLLAELEGKLLDTSDKIGDASAKLTRARSEVKKAGYRSKITDLETQKTNLLKLQGKVQDLEFEHIPIKLWFERIVGSNDPAAIGNSIKLLAGKKRKTITIADLVKSSENPNGVLDIKDLHIADVMMSQGRRAGRDFAILDILNAAKEEGLTLSAWRPIKTKSGKTIWHIDKKVIDKLAKDGYYPLPSYAAGITKGYVHKPVFANYLQSYLKGRDSVYTGFDRALAVTKMAQFTNPLVMPFYDMYQSFWSGAVVPRKGYISDARIALKSAFGRDENYFKAYDQGTFSRPYANPLRDFNSTLAAMKDTQIGAMLDDIKAKPIKAVYKIPGAPLRALYSAVHETAWKLDEVWRLFTREYFKRQGFSEVESSQLAAKFHSDYAGVPATTRTTLNRVFFTPTFKITMGKLLGEMVNSSFKALAGKGTATDLAYAKGAARVVGSLAATHIFATKILGLKTDEIFRKYKMMVTTPEGERELVFTMPSPISFYLKAPGIIKKVKAPGYIDTWGKEIVKTYKWEFHPLYRVLYSTFVSPVDDKVFNPLEDPTTKVAKQVRYLSSETIKLLRPFIGKQLDEGSKERKDLEILVNEYGKVSGTILDHLLYYYSKTPDLEQTKRKTNELRRYLLDGIKENPDKGSELIRNYIKEITDINEGIAREVERRE